MADMTIQIIVSAKGLTWSRTATIEVDTAMAQTGSTNALSTVLGTEAASSSLGIHSFAGMGVGFFANKARGSLTSIIFNGSGGYLSGVMLPSHLPFILYAGAGTGFTGATNGSASATDVPDEDIASATIAAKFGVQNTQSIIGLRAIS